MNMDGAALYMDEHYFFFIKKKSCYVRIIYFVNIHSWLFFQHFSATISLQREWPVIANTCSLCLCTAGRQRRRRFVCCVIISRDTFTASTNCKRYLTRSFLTQFTSLNPRY